MQQFEMAAEMSTEALPNPESAIGADQTMSFLVWACVWVAALAVLLPAL